MQAINRKENFDMITYNLVQLTVIPDYLTVSPSCLRNVRQNQ